MKYYNYRRYIFALAGLALGLSASAQEMTIRRVETYRVKPDRSGDFQAEIKEYLAVLKKANPSHAYTMWSSLSGSTEFYRVDDYAKYADLDAPQDPKLKDISADLARIGLRINNCADMVERQYYRLRADLSLPSPKELPKMMLVLKVKVQPEKAAAYIMLRKAYLEYLKKSPIKILSVMQGRYGTSELEFVTLRGLNSWSDLDVPNELQTVAGADAAKFNFASTQTERQYDIIRYRPELSYIPAAGTN
jgi:hypothetical protein